MKFFGFYGKPLQFDDAITPSQFIINTLRCYMTIQSSISETLTIDNNINKKNNNYQRHWSYSRSRSSVATYNCSSVGSSSSGALLRSPGCSIGPGGMSSTASSMLIKSAQSTCVMSLFTCRRRNENDWRERTKMFVRKLRCNGRKFSFERRMFSTIVDRADLPQPRQATPIQESVILQ